MKPIKRKKKPKAKSLSYWKKQLDKVFSLWVRRSAADENGMVQCVTCKYKFHWKQIQAGHYISRNHLSTRFLEQNVHPQCAGCNVFGRGRHDEYAIYLMVRYGQDILNELNFQKNKLTKFTIQDYQEKIEHYKDALVGLDMRDND